MKCRHCKKSFALKDLTNDSTYHAVDGTDHKYWTCRECNTKRYRIYRSTPEGKRITFKSVYRSVKKFADKQNARLALYRAIKAGKIKKPKVCSCCGKRKDLEGHHEDYTKPLEVKWLCRLCHSIIHK